MLTALHIFTEQDNAPPSNAAGAQEKTPIGVNVQTPTMFVERKRLDVQGSTQEGGRLGRNRKSARYAEWSPEAAS